jgi:hypothetical protein
MANPQIDSTLVQEAAALGLPEDSLSGPNISLPHFDDLPSLAQPLPWRIANGARNDQDFSSSAPSTPNSPSPNTSSSLAWTASRATFGQQTFSQTVLPDTQDNHHHEEDHDDLFPVSDSQPLTAEGIR